MKAWRYHQFGGPEVLVFEDVPLPEPGEGEILVKVAGSGVNPIDWKIRQGNPVFHVDLPAIIGHEFSGTVTKLGPGVSEFEEGDEVYGIGKSGSCAEFVIADAWATGLKPPSMDLADAASIPLAGMTAYQALFDVADLQPGHRALILAASGGVGTFAVQLANWKGAHVIATCSAKNAHLVQELGAHEIIDYQSTPFESAVRDVDMVLDGVGKDNAAKALAVLKPGGIVVCLAGPAPADEAAAQGKRAKGMNMKAKREQLDRLSALVEDLKVRPVIDTVVRFDEAVEAYKESQAGHTVGKLVIRVS